MKSLVLVIHVVVKQGIDKGEHVEMCKQTPNPIQRVKGSETLVKLKGGGGGGIKEWRGQLFHQDMAKLLIKLLGRCQT